MMEKKSILIVDDDPKHRNTIKGMLKRRGHDVSTAADGLQALDLLSKGSFDLVISETMIPNLNGIELMGEIKKRRIPVQIVFLTAHAEWEPYLEIMNMAVFDYINKPADEQEILSVVKRMPETCTRWQELAQGKTDETGTVCLR